MKKFLAVVLLLVMLLTLTACEPYTSSYKAIMLITNHTTNSCSAKFDRLTGTMVFKVRRTEPGEGDIGYSITVEEGELTLYYDALGVKEQLAKVTAGQSVTARDGYVEKGYKVYVIIEATEGTKGSVSVSLDGELPN